MSNRCLNAVFSRSKSSGVARMLLTVIADRAADDGRAWCGSADVAHRAGIERKNVPRALRELVKIGELQVLRNEGPNSCNVYVLSPSLIVRDPQAESPSPREKGSLTLSVDSHHPEAHTPVTPKEPQLLTSTPSTPSSLVKESPEIMTRWNEIPGVRHIHHLSPDRRRHLAARMKDAFFREHWSTALARIARSPFLTGRAPGKTWHADFDWFLRPGTVVKIMEGAYDPQDLPKTAPPVPLLVAAATVDRSTLDPAEVGAYLDANYSKLAQRNPPENTLDTAPELCLQNFIKWKNQTT